MFVSGASFHTKNHTVAILNIVRFLHTCSAEICLHKSVVALPLVSFSGTFTSSSLKVSILASMLSAKLSASASTSAGFFRRAKLKLAVVSKYTVLQLVCEHYREAVDALNRIAYPLCTNHDMSEELACVCIVILRESRKLLLIFRYHGK